LCIKSSSSHFFAAVGCSIITLHYGEARIINSDATENGRGVLLLSLYLFVYYSNAPTTSTHLPAELMKNAEPTKTAN